MAIISSIGTAAKKLKSMMKRVFIVEKDSARMENRVGDGKAGLVPLVSG